DEARACLQNYPWPGNVRQLKNAIERAQILADDDTITIDDLPSEVIGLTGVPVAHTPSSGAESFPARPPLPLTPRLEDVERSHIVEILKRENGNKARTARILGIHRRKLYRLLERFGIHDAPSQSSTAGTES
ncbi:MAG: helix-turn-helix domain-containing protein, partial [Planctomyces sp.]